MERFDLFVKWLADLGGEYDILEDKDLPNPKRQNYEPKHKIQQRPLNPLHYRVDENGSVRKISDEGLRLAEKLGI